MNTEELLIKTMANVVVLEARSLYTDQMLSLLFQKHPELKADVRPHLSAMNLEMMGSLGRFDCGDAEVNKKVISQARKVYSKRFLKTS